MCVHFSSNNSDFIVMKRQDKREAGVMIFLCLLYVVCMFVL